MIMHTCLLGIALHVNCRQHDQFEYGVENQKLVSKIRTHLGLFLVTTRKKVDGFFMMRKKVDFSMVQQNSAEVALVQAKGFRVPGVHPYAGIPIISLPGMFLLFFVSNVGNTRKCSRCSPLCSNSCHANCDRIPFAVQLFKLVLYCST